MVRLSFAKFGALVFRQVVNRDSRRMRYVTDPVAYVPFQIVIGKARASVREIGAYHHACFDAFCFGLFGNVLGRLLDAAGNNNYAR
jgi:hypothetical protein